VGLETVFLLLAAMCFLLHAAAVPVTRVNLQSVGLLLWILTLILVAAR
jgi:hypothetical protein